MVSLITCTLGRTAELERLLSSLEQQTYHDFEVLLVDQNSDDRVDRVIAAHPSLPIRHLHSGRGLSRGRNVALREVRGEIVAFPDDDCWYPDDVLSSVTGWFATHAEFSVLFGRLRDAEGRPVGPRLPETSCRCTLGNIMTIAASPASFIRADVAREIGFFNEHIGAGSGSDYKAGEECDYFLRPLERGHTMWYDPSLTVHHPNLHSIDRLRRTTYPYALGAGYVLRIHRCRSYFAKFLFRSLGGAVLSALKLDFANAHIYLLRAAGIVRGYFLGPRELAPFAAHH